MALIEDTNVCSLCENPVKGYVGGVPVYWCPHCWETHKEDIVAAVAWAVLLLGLEKARRKRRNRLLKSVGLPRMQNTIGGIQL